MPRISIRRSRSLREFPAPGPVRSRCGRSWCIIDGEAVMPGQRDSDELQMCHCTSGNPEIPVRAKMRVPEWQSLNECMTPTEIEKIFRDEAGRALAPLIPLVGEFDLAQDALQDAFAVALENWPAAEQPSNPRAWLVNVGRNKAIDRIRRSIAFRGKQQELMREIELAAPGTPEAGDDATLDDDM